MRRRWLWLGLLGMAIGAGCRPREAEPAAGSAVLVRAHFAGTARLSADTNAARLKEIWALPESQALWGQTLQKLARAPRALFPEAVSPEVADQGAAWLRPLLEDLVRGEAWVEARGGDLWRAEWTVAVALEPHRVPVWRSNLVALVQLWGLGTPATNALGGFPAQEVKRGTAPGLVRWVEAGPWLVLGAGEAPLPGWQAAVQRLRATGRPLPALTNAWLRATLDSPRLIHRVGWAKAVHWPHAELSVAARGEQLRTTMQLTFAEPVTGALTPWHVPTNLVREPLISFTGARGVAPWLARSATLQQLELRPIPNELYAWAQETVPFQSFLAFPASDVTNQLARIGQRLPGLVGTNLQRSGLNQITWQPTNAQVSWKALPIIVPELKPARDGGSDFILGGLFPPAPSTNPPPAALLAQFSDRTNLVYYNWEITQARLWQWRMMAQLFAVVLDVPQFSTNTAGLPWLMKVDSHLGNTVTEISAVSPREWTLVRNSHLGLTALELVTLTRWLESVDFPVPSLALPEEPRRRPPAARPVP